MSIGNTLAIATHSKLTICVCHAQVNPKCVGTGCDLIRLAERMTAVEEKLQRLEDLLVEADDDVNWDEGESHLVA